MWGCVYFEGSLVSWGMADSLYIGRFHASRSMIVKFGGGEVAEVMVSITKSVTWGQMRGVRVEQMITPID